MNAQSEMTSRQRLKNAFKCKPTDRMAWVPFVGVHGGALIGKTATELLGDEDLIVQAAAKAIELYQPDGLPVVFDLQIEAEVLGCELNWSDDNPPAVITHPLSDGGKKLAELKIPAADAGRIKTVMDAARRMNTNWPDIGFYGLVTGPFTLALHLMGTDIFMKMFDEPEYVARVMRFCEDVATAMAGYYIDAGCDFVAMVDPMTSQIGPDQFAQHVLPFARGIFRYIRSRGALGSFFVCGHAQQNIEVMCDCEPDNISIDENIPLEYVKDICLPRGISFGGNLQLTSVLLLGDENDARRNALECIDVGCETGFILAPGCDLPYATPPANLRAISEMMVDPYKRDVARTLVEQAPDEKVTLDMSEYGQADRVIVDIITLDSEACAPCQYMVAAVKDVAPQFDGIVTWREHKIKSRDSLVFMSALMVRNIPTICIDGQITFVSRIPPRDELIAAIQKRINEKMRLRLKVTSGVVYVLGTDGEKLDELYEKVTLARMELGSDVEICKITDAEKIASFGVAPNQLPAVITARHKLKSSQQVPEVAAVKEWIKDLH